MHVFLLICVFVCVHFHDCTNGICLQKFHNHSISMDILHETDVKLDNKKFCVIVPFDQNLSTFNTFFSSEEQKNYIFA